MDALVEDAIAFVRYFGFPITQSAPHIYLSALPFSPSSSVISRLYTPRFSTLHLQEGRLMKWPALEMTIPGTSLTRVNCVVWSGNDEYIAAAVFRRVYVRSASTGENLAEMHFDDEVVSITMTHDGQFLAICLESGMIWIWDVVEGKKRALKGNGVVSAVSFAEDSKQLVLGLHDGTVRIWDLEKEVAGEPFNGHSNPVWAVSFLDKEHIVSRSGFRMVLVWNIKTRERVTRPGVPTGTIHTVLHDCEGPRFYDDNSSFDVCSWTEATKEEGKFNWNLALTPAAVFSTDGTLVATCSPDHVHVWHAGDGSVAGAPFNVNSAVCLAFSADGRRIATGSGDGFLCVWNVQRVDEDGNEFNERGGPLLVAFTPDGKKIVVARKGGGVEVLDRSTGQEVARITERNNEDWNTISVNDNRIASATVDCIYIWNRTGEAVAGPLTTIDDHDIFTLALSQGPSDLLAYATYDDDCSTVCVLSASTGALIGRKKWDADVVKSFLAFSPSTVTQTHLAVGLGLEIFVWDIMTHEVAGPFSHHGDYLSALMFSSDGRYITSVGQDCTLCLWDSSSGKIVRGPLKAMTEGFPVTFSALLAHDGRKVAFSGTQSTVLVFDVVYEGDSDIVLHNRLVLPGNMHNLCSLAFSTNGQYLATHIFDGTISIWNLWTALKRKQLISSSAANISEVINWDEGWINSDGWFVPTNRFGFDARRLFWVPGVHRSGLYRPSITCMISGQKKTRLDIENFVYGEKWGDCLLGST